MSTVQLNGSGAGSALQELLVAPDITPGDTPSYQLCKTIYAYHPLGAKLAEKPITLAQSKPRVINVQKGPETMVKEEFEAKWKEVGADASIFNLMALSRVYGVASMALLVDGQAPDRPVDLKSLYKRKVAFNVFDPLNTAGSLVINQDANAMDFMKTDGTIRVSGTTYHRSRTCVMMNEQPLYIAYTNSGFGFVGRSVYQRILFPLKSFIQTMMTDDLVAVKAGVIVAKLKQPGSVIDNIMQKMFALKRQVIKDAKTYNVISVGPDDTIETLDFTNLDGAFGQSRKDILENIAAGADDMPAMLLNQETFAEGFGEGTEDAAMVAHYVDRIREKMQPAYAFMDPIVQHLAWTPEFYARVQKLFPEEYSGVPFETAFYEWVNSFTAEWPSFMEEPPSDQVQVDDVKLKAVIAMVQVLLPAIDPENRAKVIEWACDNFNALKLLFDTPLELDFDALATYEPEEALEEPAAGKPFADAAVAQFSAATARLVATLDKKRERLRAIGGGRA